MCITTKRFHKRAATAANKVTFSKPSILAICHMNNDTSSSFSQNPASISPIISTPIDLDSLVHRVLRQYQQQSAQKEVATLSSLKRELVPATSTSTSTSRKRVRFDASVKMPQVESSTQKPSTPRNKTLNTSQLLLQVRIVLNILEKDDPHLKHRLVQSIDRCRRTLSKRRTFNRLVDAVMRHMVKPEIYRVATEARMRLAAAN